MNMCWFDVGSEHENIFIYNFALNGHICCCKLLNYQCILYKLHMCLLFAKYGFGDDRENYQNNQSKPVPYTLNFRSKCVIWCANLCSKISSKYCDMHYSIMSSRNQCDRCLREFVTHAVAIYHIFRYLDIVILLIDWFPEKVKLTFGQINQTIVYVTHFSLSIKLCELFNQCSIKVRQFYIYLTEQVDIVSFFDKSNQKYLFCDMSEHD